MHIAKREIPTGDFTVMFNGSPRLKEHARCHRSHVSQAFSQTKMGCSAKRRGFSHHHRVGVKAEDVSVQIENDTYCRDACIMRVL